MKKIKFRAWEKERKRIFEPSSIRFDEEQVGYVYFLDFDEVELMQFTGLKDKNNKEIYESDIIKAKIGAVDFILKIEFENGKFMAVGDDDLTAFDLFTITDKCEVIGNIYENEDLLK